MSRTVADASRDYRKRRADRLGRYEAALREISDDLGVGPEGYRHKECMVIARNALNPVTAGGDE